MNINEMDELEYVKYPKDQFKKDVEKWSSDKDLKFVLSEDWGDYSFWGITIKGISCHIANDMIFIADDKFYLDLYDNHYEVYVSKEYINNEQKIFKYPIYLIYIKGSSYPRITIEIL